MVMSNPAGEYLMTMASGTSRNPGAFAMPMLIPASGSWNTMFMGSGFIVDTQQSGPRGGDKLYAPNWFMGMAEHKAGSGSFMFEAMLSLDAATITERQYPLLFQTGETAFGKPLVDAQHPHDLFMSIGVHYAHPVGANTILQLYYAPVGDPALGPVAFPHRASASELPQAPIGHHWEDSTHIADNVVTAAIEHRWLRVEASGFFGSEPDENRWNFDFGPMNSWSVRASVMPSPHWMAQVSTGHLVNPEREHPGNVTRTTASVHYTRGGWSSSLIFGRNANLNAYLAETVVPAGKKNFITGRAEHVRKDELAVAGVYGIQAYTVGYTRDLAIIRGIETGIGANISLYAIPGALHPSYGDHPRGVNIYLRFRLRPSA